MCRWIAYTGKPTRLEDVVIKPARSLVHQSLHAEQCKTATNGDGFGIGWYGDREMPGLYREISPAWSDENLLSLCSQLSASTFFAHVRASTGTGTARTNCHPFSVDPWMFMHNGQVGRFHLVRRAIENLIADNLYGHRRGGTDSEAMFLIALARFEQLGPVASIRAMLQQVEALMNERGIDEPLRFAAALTNGRQLAVFRYANDGMAPSVWYRVENGSLVVVSEPIDDRATGWEALAQNRVLLADCGAVEAPPQLLELMPTPQTRHQEAVDSLTAG
ncbi:MAG: class II glutamine amidotransferase [Burkholderiaceae bacterium]